MRIEKSFKNKLSSIGGRFLLWKMEHFPNKKDIRITIRTNFEVSIKQVVEGKGDIINDPIWGSMLIQGAIGASYQSMKKDSHLSLLALRAGADYDRLLEDECQRALNKYLE